MFTQKQAIADSFSRSAHQYDEAAQLQHRTGCYLLDILKTYFPEKTTTHYTMADVGCGTGYLTAALLQAYQPQKYIGVDIAPGMLDVAAKKNAEYENVEWVCGDAENLPLPENSVDIIYANFSLQWCEDLPALLHSFNRVLRMGGVCCFTTLGPESLYEMRNAWFAVDQYQHVNNFYDRQQWKQAIDSYPFSIIHSYQHRETLCFDSPLLALRSIKAIGANTVKGDQQRALMGKKRFNLFVHQYEQYRCQEGIPVTYDIDGWILKKT